jgi:hypothetical protein
VVRFSYPELSEARRHCWLGVDPAADIDLCSSDPEYEVDLWVTTDLRTMTAICMGIAKLGDVRDKIQLDGDPEMARTIQTWLGLSTFSRQTKLVH